jgi:hypothetical protein
MNPLDIIKKFYTKVKPRTEEEITKRLEDKKVEGLITASKLRHLIKDKTGWAEVVRIIQDYIEYCQLLKLNTSLDTADEKTLERLKLLDREVYVLNWVLKIPEQFIEKVEKAEKEKTDE